MPFKKGEGGRPKGAPNKVGKAARDVWQRMGGPDGELYAQQLHAIAVEPHGDVHARLKALAIIAPHVWKKLAERVELSGTDGQPLVIRWQKS